CPTPCVRRHCRFSWKNSAGTPPTPSASFSNHSRTRWGPRPRFDFRQWPDRFSTDIIDFAATHVILTTMRAFFAALLSLALMVSQMALVPAPAPSRHGDVPKCCGHCHKGVPSAACCAPEKNSSDAQPLPAAPSGPTSQTDLQLLTASLSHTLIPEFSHRALVFHSIVARGAFVARLHQRHCVLLI